MIRVALVGYGYAGKTFHAPLIRAAKGLELATVVSSRPDDVHADLPDVTVAPDLAAALTDDTIQLVVIATPNEQHAPMAHEALDAGRHVVIDKPFALSMAEGKSVLAHAARANRIVSVFHCRRWDSSHLTLKSVRDLLGDIYKLELHFDRWRPEVRDRWRERAGPGSGVWFDLGAHLIDQALDLFGEPDWIDADIQAQRSGAQTDDYFHVVLGYGSHRVILHASMLAHMPGHTLDAQGANGILTIFDQDSQEGMLKAGVTPGSDNWGASRGGLAFAIRGGDPAFDPEDYSAIPGNYLAYYEDMARAISENAPSPVTGEDALKVMKWLELGFLSSREGRRVTME